MNKNKPITFSLLILVALYLSGCAVMSVEECEVADWGELGYKHGTNGVPANSNKLAPYIKACGKGGITPDRKLYENGRAAGARVYCEPENGFIIGRSGKPYNNICDSDLQDDFLDEYDLGRELYTYEEAVRIVENDIHHLEKDRHELQDDIADLRVELKHEETTPQERIEIKDDIYRIKQGLDNIENELDRMAYRLIQKEIARDDFKRERGYY